jgi:hypothetical protein
MEEVDCMEFEKGSETMKNVHNKNEQTKTEREKAVGWMHPNQMDVDGFITVGDGVYNGDFVITGVETKSNGDLRFKSLEDMIAYPYSHGLMTAIETIAHIYRQLECSKVLEEDSDFYRLKIRFEANISDAFKGNENPTAWIHLGHGLLEHDFALIEDLEEDEEEYESIPGISNGHEEESFLCARSVQRMLQEKEGHILFVALPLCYANQIGNELIKSEVIQLMHAPTDFAVSETLEFYDGASNKDRCSQVLNGWNQWVKQTDALLGPSMLERKRRKDGDE